MLIVDSVITSNAFTMAVKKSNKAAFAFDLPSIQKVLGSVKAGVDVASTSSRQLSFTGKEHLTFAFTLLRVHLNADGSMSALEPGDASRVLAVAATSQVHQLGFSHVELAAEPAMVDLEEAPAQGIGA
jgi:hypothetical protein